MKAISLWQPWATLIAIGAKRYETRSWSTNYRGPIAIHASARLIDTSEWNPVIWKVLYPPNSEPVKRPYSCIVCVVDLVDVLYTEEAPKSSFWHEQEVYFGDYTPGRFAWRLANVRLVDNVRAVGRQGLWNWTPPEGMTL